MPKSGTESTQNPPKLDKEQYPLHHAVIQARIDGHANLLREVLKRPGILDNINQTAHVGRLPRELSFFEKIFVKNATPLDLAANDYDAWYEVFNNNHSAVASEAGRVDAVKVLMENGGYVTVSGTYNCRISPAAITHQEGEIHKLFEQRPSWCLS